MININIIQFHSLDFNFSGCFGQEALQQLIYVLFRYTFYIRGSKPYVHLN